MEDVNPYQNCPSEAGLDDAVLYAAGTLEQELIDAFEVHLLGCARCQGAVGESVEIAGALRAGAPRPAARVWLVPTLAAAGIALVFLIPSPNGLERLGSVEDAPAFNGVPVRSEGDASIVDRGMAAYAAGDWADAAALLAEAPESDSTAGTLFFLGAAHLMRGDASGAADALDRAAQLQGPYAVEARFYAAKAWLALGNGELALERLLEVPTDAPRVGAWARALADSVQQHR